MLLRVELSVSGLEKLTAFCKENIRPVLDAAETAFELMQTGAYGSDDPSAGSPAASAAATALAARFFADLRP